MREAVEQLPREQREAIVVVHVMGHSTAEAAELLGVSETSVRHRIARGLPKLAKLLRGVDLDTMS